MERHPWHDFYVERTPYRPTLMERIWRFSEAIIIVLAMLGAIWVMIGLLGAAQAIFGG